MGQRDMTREESHSCVLCLLLDFKIWGGFLPKPVAVKALHCLRVNSWTL